MKNTPRALIALIKTAANVMLQPPEGGGCRQGSGSLFALVVFFSHNMAALVTNASQPRAPSAERSVNCNGNGKVAL